MRVWYAVLMMAAITAVLPGGCGPADTASTGGAPTDAAGAKDATPVQLVEADFATIEKAIQEKKGSVILTDFWALWCPPCRASFPHFVKLHEKYRDQGLVCMSISIDTKTPNARNASQDFLTARRATFPNFHWVKVGNEAEHLYSFFAFGGGIPHQVLFSRSGNRVWDSSHDNRELEDVIEQELLRPAP